MIKLKYKYQIIKILFLIAMLTSVAMSLEETTELCGNESGCDIVEQTKYSSTFGIKNYWFGIIIFAYLWVITDLYINKPTEKKEKIIKYGIIASAIVSIYFLYLQQYIIEAYCKYCIVIDTSLIIAAVIYFLTKES